jgi:hypothetical protein
MPKIIKNVSDMEIDEISLVDRGANQHALVTIAKRASDEEDNMPDIELYNEQGDLLAEDAELSEGDVVYDEEGNAYELAFEDDEADDNEEELEPVGKRYENPFSLGQRREPVTKSYSQTVLEELSKAYSDEERDAVLSKAFGEMDQLRSQVAYNEEIAKSERDLRLTREYIAKADEYNLPVASEELGPVLYRMAETMSYDDCAVIAKCLESAGSLIFDEVGYIGGGDNSDVMSQVNAYAQTEIGKADSESISKVFDENPDAYEEYLAQRG